MSLPISYGSGWPLSSSVNSPPLDYQSSIPNQRSVSLGRIDGKVDSRRLFYASLRLLFSSTTMVLKLGSARHSTADEGS